MTRDQAVNAYRRTSSLERVRYARLRQVVVSAFGSFDGCRTHNCILNYEAGVSEGPQHKAQYKAAKRFLHLERKHYDEIDRLKNHFARYF